MVDFGEVTVAELGEEAPRGERVHPRLGPIEASNRFVQMPATGGAAARPIDLASQQRGPGLGSRSIDALELAGGAIRSAQCSRPTEQTRMPRRLHRDPAS